MLCRVRDRFVAAQSSKILLDHVYKLICQSWTRSSGILRKILFRSVIVIMSQVIWKVVFSVILNYHGMQVFVIIMFDNIPNIGYFLRLDEHPLSALSSRLRTLSKLMIGAHCLSNWAQLVFRTQANRPDFLVVRAASGFGYSYEALTTSEAFSGAYRAHA